jgi:hypothetical protein
LGEGGRVAGGEGGRVGEGKGGRVGEGEREREGKRGRDREGEGVSEREREERSVLCLVVSSPSDLFKPTCKSAPVTKAQQDSRLVHTDE